MRDDEASTPRLGFADPLRFERGALVNRHGHYAGEDALRLTIDEP